MRSTLWQGVGSPLVGVTGKLENINLRGDWARVTAPGLRKIGDRVYTVYSTGYYIHNYTVYTINNT